MKWRSASWTSVAIGLLLTYAALAFGVAALPPQGAGADWARPTLNWLQAGLASGWIHTTAGWLALLAAGALWIPEKKSLPRWLPLFIMAAVGILLLPLLLPGIRPLRPSPSYEFFWPHNAAGWPMVLVAAWLPAFWCLSYRPRPLVLRLSAVLSYLMMTGAAFGVAGNFLRLNLIYDQPLFAPIPGALAVALFILAVLLRLRRQAWLAARNPGHSREDSLISAIGLGMLVTIAFFTGLSSFMALQSQEEGSLYRAQLQSMDNRIIMFYNAMDAAFNEVGSLSHHGEVARLLAALDQPAHAADALMREQLLTAAAANMPFTVEAFEFRSTSGTVLARRGQLTPAETIWVEYRDATEIRLNWSKGTPFIGMTVRINDGAGVKVGELVVELPTGDWEQLVSDTYELGRTGNMMICGVEAEVLRCLESRQRHTVSSPPDSTALGAMIQDALEGERSAAGTPHIAVREGGKPVVVTYGPIGKVRMAIKAPGVGLAMLILTDAEEFYEPIRLQLQKILPLLLGIIVVGVVTLRRLVVPLIRALRDKEARFRALTELSSDWYWEMDAACCFVQIAGEVERKGGFSAADSLGKPLWEQDWIFGEGNNWAELRRALEAGEPFHEHTVRMRDLHGAVRYLAISGQPIYGAEQDIIGFRGTGKDVTEKHLAEEHIQFLAHFDSLTQLPNRAFLNEQLRFAIERAKRHQKKLALLFLDLDRFKVINDTLGHDAGDEVLRIVARRISECVRDSDMVSRLGGDEFVVLLEDIFDSAHVRVTAQRILDLINAPFELCGAPHSVGASIGISVFPDDADCIDGLLKHSDDAMYRAKKDGRNGIYFFASVMAEGATVVQPEVGL